MSVKEEIVSTITSRLYNLHLGLFYPQTKLMSKNDVLSVLESGFLGPTFYGLPVLVPTSLILEQSVESDGKCYLWVGTEDFALFKVLLSEVFYLELDGVLAKTLGTSDKSHPGYQQFLTLGNEFLSGEIVDVVDTPASIAYTEQLNSIKKMDNLATIATRNSPHLGHIQMVNYLNERYFNTLVSLTVNLNSNDYATEGTSQLLHWKEASLKYGWKDVQFVTIFEKSYLAGPREACLQALMRKNLGSKFFVIGRDHSGVANFYSRYDSQKAASQISQEIGIEIISYPGSIYCRDCKKVLTRGDCDHSEKNQDDISASELRRIKAQPEVKEM